MVIIQCLFISSALIVNQQIFGYIFSPMKFTARKKIHLHDKSDISTHSSTYDYSALKILQERCKRISSKESTFLLSFWSHSLNGFQIYPNFSSNHRISITTSCITLQTILQNPIHWANIIKWEHPGQKLDSQINLKNIVEALYSVNWNGDAFQTPVLVGLLAKLKAININEEKYKNSVDILLDQRSRLSLHRNQPYSSYLRYQNSKALLAIVENDFVPEEIRGSHQIGYALERGNMVAFDELSRQLAFYYSGDIAKFDVVVLAYSLLTYYITSQNVFLQSFAKGVIENTNIKLIKSALKLIFDSQMLDGTWRKGEPIFSLNDYSPSGTSTKRDIGNSYVFFLDMVGSLVEVLTPAHAKLFEPYISNLEKCVAWIENNILEEMMPEECDPVTKRCFGTVIRGWRSNHLGTGGAIGWCTAQVFSSVTSIKTLLQSLITSNVLTEFNGVPAESVLSKVNNRELTSSSSTHKKDWIGLMDADLFLSAGQTDTTLKTELFSRLIQPQVNKDRNILKSYVCPSLQSWTTTSLSSSDATVKSNKNNANKDTVGFSKSTVKKFPPSYSCILFGPPGTAKTTICTSIANYLQWNFMVIDTACFLADGLQNIASRMTYIFDRLKGLDKTLILLDEIEEFCLDRENPNLAMESRLLTTAMLTQLNDLRRQQSVIFIVATNRLRSFDSAVTRPGRFDMLLFVGTPSASARLDRLQSKLKNIRSNNINESSIELIQNTVKEFILKYWENRVRFLTFAENELFISSIADHVVTHMTSNSNDGEDTRTDADKKLDTYVGITEAELMDILVNIEAVSTIKGPVREEYCISETLSRV